MKITDKLHLYVVIMIDFWHFVTDIWKKFKIQPIIFAVSFWKLVLMKKPYFINFYLVWYGLGRSDQNWTRPISHEREKASRRSHTGLMSLKNNFRNGFYISFVVVCAERKVAFAHCLSSAVGKIPRWTKALCGRSQDMCQLHVAGPPRHQLLEFRRARPISEIGRIIDIVQ